MSIKQSLGTTTSERACAPHPVPRCSFAWQDRPVQTHVWLVSVDVQIIRLVLPILWIVVARASSWAFIWLCCKGVALVEKSKITKSLRSCAHASIEDTYLATDVVSVITRRPIPNMPTKHKVGRESKRDWNPTTKGYQLLKSSAPSGTELSLKSPSLSGTIRLMWYWRQQEDGGGVRSIR